MSLACFEARERALLGPRYETLLTPASDAAARGAAYLALAENAEAKGDAKSAVAYATVVTSLFDDAALVGAAKKILEEHPEAKEAK